MTAAGTIVLFSAAVCFIGGLSNKACAEELRLRLQVIEENLSDTRATRDKLGRSAQKTANELRQIKQLRVDLAKSLYRYSAQANKLEARLRKLQEQELEQSNTMALLQEKMSVTLIAVQRLALKPAVILVTSPQSFDKTIRSGILLRAIIAQIRRETDKLSEQIRELIKVRVRITEDKKLLSMTLSRLEGERLALQSLTMKKKTLLSKTQTEKKRAIRGATRLSRQAENIRDILKKLKKRQNPEILGAYNFDAQRSLTPFKLIEGTVPAPGRIVTTFGQRMPNGVLSKGVYIATPPAAPVVAPTKGRVVFAGMFRGYGNLVILELPDMGHALFSGMAQISAVEGDDIFAGEPLGEMAQSPEGSQRLYFELRKKGRPINPLLPEAASRNKVRG
ncbi:MAG: peptidoglycan DD-metalloendopeptidase family protein [Pseudomonadota bacterium]|nr:peptidoglycan DD-metalloendopeptidase family protein [Pseudomonadota bacterium]